MYNKSFTTKAAAEEFIEYMKAKGANPRLIQTTQFIVSWEMKVE